VSTPYEQTGGRVRQKERTRQDLLAAARALIAEGGAAPTVEQAAARASVSRATAYRYFPTRRALLAAAHPETVSPTMLPSHIGDDPRERVVAAVDRFTRMIVDTERQQRTMLRLSVEAEAESELPLRQGRAIAWFEEALAPVASMWGAVGVRSVAVAIRAVAGIEALVWLTDVADLDRAAARALMCWNAAAVLDRALAEGPPP
jgi:AcrR family transcriptional regulator